MAWSEWVALSLIVLFVLALYGGRRVAQQQALEEERQQVAQQVAAEQRRLRNARTLAQLLELTPEEFERHVGLLLAHRGYRDLTTTKATGDRGVDLSGQDPDGRSVVIQCKRYLPTARVGGAAVRDLAGTVRLHRADRGILVTTSDYTRDAAATARDCAIELLAGADLVRLHRATFPELHEAAEPPAAAQASAGPSDRAEEGFPVVQDALTRERGAAPTNEPSPLTTAPQRIEREIVLADGRKLHADVEVHGRLRLDGLSVVPPLLSALRPAWPSTDYEVVVELGNTGDREQSFEVDILWRSADGGALTDEGPAAGHVPRGARAVWTRRATLGPNVRGMDVTIRSRREHCPSGQQATGPERLEKVLKLAHGDGVLAAVEMSGLVELEGLSIVPLGGPVPNASILIVELRNAAAVEQYVDIDTVLRSADDGALGHRAEFIGPVPAGGRGIGRTYAVLGPDVKEIAVFTRAEPSGVLEDAAALQVLEPAIRLPNGRHLQGRVELHGQLRLDSFSAAYERDARPDEYQVSIEVGNSTAIDQLVSVHLLLRSSDGTPVDFEEHLIDSVAATGRGLARCGATIGPDIRQIDVLVRAVPEAIPGAEGVVVTAGQDAEASHKQDHLAVACKVVERQVRLADGRSLPAKAELQGRVRLDGISVVQERNPRPDEYQVLTEVVNTADTEQYFDVGILLRSADGDTVGYEDSFIDRVAPGARGIGRAWAMVGPEVTQIEMTVKATS